MERPNTIAGLIAKRDELLNLRETLRDNVRKVTCDIDHLEAAIQLFDPESTPEAIKRYAVKHRATKGHVTRFILEFFRKTEGGVVTTQDLTIAWLTERGLRADDATFAIIRKRIGACVIKLKAQGVVEAGGMPEGYREYRMVERAA